MLLSCGQSTVRFMPPLMIGEADVDEAIELLDKSLDEVLADQRPQVDQEWPRSDRAARAGARPLNRSAARTS